MGKRLIDIVFDEHGWTPKVWNRFESAWETKGPDECWLWRAELGGVGQYPTFTWYQPPASVDGHRTPQKKFSGKKLVYAYINDRADILTPRWNLRSTCKNTICVNPDHHWLYKSNKSKQRKRGPKPKAKTCRNGHDLTLPGSTKPGTKSGKRVRLCVECIKAANARRVRDADKQREYNKKMRQRHEAEAAQRARAYYEQMVGG